MEESAIRTNNISLAIISSLHGVNHLLQLILPTILPSLITEFQISNYTAGMLVSSFAIPYALLQLPFGYLSDRKGRKRILVFGLFLYSFATLLCGLSQNTLQLGIAQIFAGIGGATYHPIGVPLVSLVVERRRIGQAQGFHQTGGSIGSFIAPLTAAYIGAAFNWRYSFILLSLFGLVTCLLVLFGIEDPSYADLKKRARARKTLFDLKIMRLILSLFIFGLVAVISYRSALEPFLTTYATGKYGIGLESAAQLLALLQVGGIFGAPIFGKLSDMIGRRPMLAVLTVCQSAIMFFITYVSLEFLAILLVTMGLVAFGTIAVIDTFLTEMEARHIIGTLVGVVLTATFLSKALFSPIIGFLADQFGFDFSFRIILIFNLIALPTLVTIKYKEHASNSD